ncbi:MAG TPA: hypothetical protein VL882_27780 [Vicinamibacterales bacterium]|jgi:hypothetical protein|nr:hypothetical protein [Vicinamibacterales bacterium]
MEKSARDRATTVPPGGCDNYLRRRGFLQRRPARDPEWDVRITEFAGDLIDMFDRL